MRNWFCMHKLINFFFLVFFSCRHWSNEWSCTLHQRRLESQWHKNRDLNGNLEYLLTHRLTGRRQNLRLDWPPVHYRVSRGHLLHRSAAHGVCHKLCFPHGGSLRRRCRRRIRSHDRSRLHSWTLSGFHSRLSHLISWGLCFFFLFLEIAFLFLKTETILNGWYFYFPKFWNTTFKHSNE